MASDRQIGRAKRALTGQVLVQEGSRTTWCAVGASYKGQQASSTPSHVIGALWPGSQERDTHNHWLVDERDVTVSDQGEQNAGPDRLRPVEGDRQGIGAGCGCQGRARSEPDAAISKTVRRAVDGDGMERHVQAGQASLAKGQREGSGGMWLLDSLEGGQGTAGALSCDRTEPAVKACLPNRNHLPIFFLSLDSSSSGAW